MNKDRENIMPIRIYAYVDMDGVLCNFSKPISLATGIPADLIDRRMMNEEQTALFIEYMKGRDHSFWANLEPLKGWDELIKFVETLDSNWHIATSPNENPACYSGKVMWINRHLGDKMHGRLFIGKHKERLAKEHSILIDDSVKKCVDFRNAGGKAVLYTGWNKLSQRALQVEMENLYE